MSARLSRGSRDAPDSAARGYWQQVARRLSRAIP